LGITRAGFSRNPFPWPTNGEKKIICLLIMKVSEQTSNLHGYHWLCTIPVAAELDPDHISIEARSALMAGRA